MVITYADETFYATAYHAGETQPVSGPAFRRYAILATKEIRARTYGNIDESREIPEPVKYCCCEVVDRLHRSDTARGDKGLILERYDNDGESGTFAVQDEAAAEVAKDIGRIVRSWLLDTGLMFCGVVKKHES